MVVGVSVVNLRLDALQTLKDKRALLQSIKARVRNRFNASVSEVGRQDSVKELVLGFAVVGGSAPAVRQVLEDITGFIEQGFPHDTLEVSISVDSYNFC